MAKVINGESFEVCEEQIEGLQEGCNDQGPWARKPYLVLWGDRWRFAKAMKGASSTPSEGGPWIRVAAYPYPDPFEGGNIFAKDVTFEPVGNVIVGSDPIAFTHAICTVLFGALTWDELPTDDPLGLNSLSQDPDELSSLRYADQEVDYLAEWAAIPGASVKYKTSGDPVTTDISKRSNVNRMVVTWNQYPLLPMTKIRDYADCVNDKTFLGCAKGTVMFEGCKTRRQQAPDGTITQQVTMAFKWRAQDWNKFLLPTGLSYDWIVDKANSIVYPYEYKDFRNLLLRWRTLRYLRPDRFCRRDGSSR